MGPGTATRRTAVASEAMGLGPDKITVQMGSTTLSPGPMQGGSNLVSQLQFIPHQVFLQRHENRAAEGGLQVARFMALAGSIFQKQA